MKSFNYPLPAGELWAYCDPNVGGDFHKPFQLPYDEVGIANGYLAMRATVLDWVNAPEVEVVENEAAAERVESLPWHFFDHAEREGLSEWNLKFWERDWKSLEDRRSGALARPELNAWEVGMEHGAPWMPVRTPRLRVGKRSVLVPLPLLQLVLKLPGVQVYVGGLSPKGWMCFRWNGGRGMLASVPVDATNWPRDKVRELYGIWSPKLENKEILR